MTRKVREMKRGEEFGKGALKEKKRPERKIKWKIEEYMISSKIVRQWRKDENSYRKRNKREEKKKKRLEEARKEAREEQRRQKMKQRRKKEKKVDEIQEEKQYK